MTNLNIKNLNISRKLIIILVSFLCLFSFLFIVKPIKADTTDYLTTDEQAQVFTIYKEMLQYYNIEFSELTSSPNFYQFGNYRLEQQELLVNNIIDLKTYYNRCWLYYESIINNGIIGPDAQLFNYIQTWLDTTSYTWNDLLAECRLWENGLAIGYNSCNKFLQFLSWLMSQTGATQNSSTIINQSGSTEFTLKAIYTNTDRDLDYVSTALDIQNRTLSVTANNYNYSLFVVFESNDEYSYTEDDYLSFIPSDESEEYYDENNTFATDVYHGVYRSGLSFTHDCNIYPGRPLRYFNSDTSYPFTIKFSIGTIQSGQTKIGFFSDIGVNGTSILSSGSSSSNPTNNLVVGNYNTTNYTSNQVFYIQVNNDNSTNIYYNIAINNVTNSYTINNNNDQDTINVINKSVQTINEYNEVFNNYEVIEKSYNDNLNNYFGQIDLTNSNYALPSNLSNGITDLKSIFSDTYTTMENNGLGSLIYIPLVLSIILMVLK